MQPFHAGPSLLALNENVPILPMYIKGAGDILPPGTQNSEPAPVFVRVGPLLRFPEGTSIPDCKQQMEDAIRSLASQG